MLLFISCSKPTENTMDTKLKNSYFAMCYTQQFAKRFSLPESNAIGLSQGLHAIAIEVRPVSKTYDTFIHLYIDSKLDVYSPGMDCNYYFTPKAETFFANKYRDKDTYWGLDFSSKAKKRMLLISQKGVGQSLVVDMFRKEFLPGLNLLSAQVIYLYLDIKHGPSEIFVQKNNAGDYLLDNDNPINPKHPENFYRFKIPEKLHNTIQPYVKHIDSKIRHIEDLGYDFSPEVEFP
jgi:hypothetical protein